MKQGLKIVHTRSAKSEKRLTLLMLPASRNANCSDSVWVSGVWATRLTGVKRSAISPVKAFPLTTKMRKNTRYNIKNKLKIDKTHNVLSRKLSGE